MKSKSFLLLFIFILTYLVPLNNRLLWQPDETRYAEISREMLSRNNWIVPHLLNIRYFEKPSPGYWINNFSQIIFGNTNFAVRFGVVFSTIVNASLIYWLAIIMWCNRNTALIATLIYISMFLVFSIGTYSVLDPIFTMWLTACMSCCFWLLKTITFTNKLFIWIMIGFTCGIAFMTKGFLALAIPIIVMLPIMCYQKRLTEALKFGMIAVLSGILINIPWAFAIYKYEPDYWNYFFWIEHIQRFFSENAQHKGPFWFYIPVVILGVIPWLGFLPGALFKCWKEREISPEMFFLFYWINGIFLFFSIAKGKLVTYILPIMTPLALIIARYIVDSIKNYNLFPFKFNGLINVILSITGIVVLINMGIYVDEPLYSPSERTKLVLSTTIFCIWFFISYFSLIFRTKYWLINSICSALLSLSISYVLPENVIDSKLPQKLIKQNITLLQQSKFILTNSVGVGASLAWELHRDDIYLYEKSGELTYGLNYPDSKFRLIKQDNFAQWLSQIRRKGSVSLVIISRKKENFINYIPKADHIICNTRMAIINYYQHQ